MVRVQFREPLTDDDYARLAEWLKANPDVTLRAYGTSGSPLENLDFLRWFPGLTRLSIDLPGLTDLRPLEQVAESLTYLNLDYTAARVDLTHIPARNLRGLRLVKHELGLGSLLGSNQSLRSVALWNYSAADRVVAHLPVRSLETLAITNGSIKETSALGELEGLRLLVLRGVRGFGKLDFLSRLEKLEWLWVESLKFEALPSLRGHESLVRVDLDSVSTLNPDMIAAVSEAPALIEVVVTSAKLKPPDFEPLARHATLAAARIGLSSIRRFEEAARLLAKRAPSTYWDFAKSRALDLAI
ncbi:hypothetical protein Ais01nite_44670 [Asanoa ishikariensis]|nr:hypothetical protein Ais01nite_44670 [Asanoa ishikariensis]